MATTLSPIPFKERLSRLLLEVVEGGAELDGVPEDENELEPEEDVFDGVANENDELVVAGV